MTNIIRILCVPIACIVGIGVWKLGIIAGATPAVAEFVGVLSAFGTLAGITIELLGPLP